MQIRQAKSDWPILIVGDYLFEPTIGLISGPGGAHRVCARTSTLLLYLAEHRNEVVTRDRLIRDLWHDAPGASKAVGQCIGRLRHYFDDTARSARYIETIPSRGYRLVAAVYSQKPDAVAVERPAPANGKRGNGNRLARFVLELRDRKVCRAMLIYFIVVWLIAQVSEIVAPALGLPEWFTSFTVVVGILGFPIAAVLAWIFDITPEGLVIDLRTESNPVSGASRSRLELLIDTTLIACAALLAGQLLVESFSASAIASGEGEVTHPQARLSQQHVHTIAVAPLSVSADDEAARTVAAEFLDHITRTLIGREGFIVVSDAALDITRRNGDAGAVVDSVLSGFVFTDGDEFRVSVYLRDARSDTYILSRSFGGARLERGKLATEAENTTLEILRALGKPIEGETRAADTTSIADPAEPPLGQAATTRPSLRASSDEQRISLARRGP